MIKRWRYGTMDNELKTNFREMDKVLNDNMTPQTSEEVLDGHVSKSFETTDGDNSWYGREISTGGEDGTQMVDSGTGKPFILRTFEFGINPQTSKMFKDLNVRPSKQEIFNSHWPQIRTVLWGDGLVANEDVEPRIVIGADKYQIFVLCEPKMRTMVAERPQTLQDVFKK